MGRFQATFGPKRGPSLRDMTPPLGLQRDLGRKHLPRSSPYEVDEETRALHSGLRHPYGPWEGPMGRFKATFGPKRGPFSATRHRPWASNAT